MPTPIELLAPAGDWPSLHAAVEAGADSVYFGTKALNMRHLAGNFDVSELTKVMCYLHEHNCRGYLTINTIIYDSELEKMHAILDAACAAGVEAVIAWDMAVLTAARERGIPIHLSTQASVANSTALAQYTALGIQRVVLARECTLDALRRIAGARDTAGVQCAIEVFIHGAMCVSISGRCFLSQYTDGASANRGACLQPCRHEYDIISQQGDHQFIVGTDYILSPKDLCALPFIEEVIATGVDSLKIEGRMRAAEYIRTVTEVYRAAIDHYYAGTLTEPIKDELMSRLRTVFNRGFSTGFYFGRAEAISRGLEHLYEKVFCGEVVKFYKKIMVAEVVVRAEGLSIGDEIIFVGKDTSTAIMPITSLQCEHKEMTSVAKGVAVGIKVLFPVKPGAKVFLWRKK